MLFLVGIWEWKMQSVLRIYSPNLYATTVRSQVNTRSYFDYVICI